MALSPELRQSQRSHAHTAGLSRKIRTRVLHDQYNVIPVFFAGLLHAAIIAAMLFVFDFSRPVHPAVPLAIKGTLVTEEALRRPPPEPEPEPKIEPEPAISEQERIAAEERKRQEDLRIEQQRISRLKKQQQQEADRKSVV